MLGLGRRAPVAPRRTFFRYGARQRFAPVKTGLAFANNGRISEPLPRVGFLASLLVQLTGTMNLGAAGVLTTRGPWDLVKELIVRVNIGASTVYRTTGYGNYVIQRTLTRAFDIANNWGQGIDADLYAAGVAMGNNTWTLTYWIPIAENYGRQSHLGLLNLQAPEIQVNLDVNFGQASDVVSNVGTGFTGTLDIGYLYYDVPNPQKVAWPPLIMFRTIESDQPIANTGDQVFTSPREGILHRVFHVVQVNDARTNGVSRLAIKANKTDEWYRYDRWQLKFLQQNHYGAPLPTGVYAHEWWAAEGEPGEGDNRDFVASEQLSTLESVVTTTGAVGGALNRLDTIRQFNQVIAL